MNKEKLKIAYELCEQKFHVHMKNQPCGMPAEVSGTKNNEYYPDAVGTKLDFMYNWMTSYITGLAPLFYKTTKKNEYIIWANGFRKYYHDKVFETPLETMHDLGFLYSLYSVEMYELTGEEGHKADAIKAADELAKRFDMRGHYIDAWRKMDETGTTGRAIVDCMMNLELLLWAWKQTTNSYYRDVALLHAETTIKYFVRDDFSVAHSYNFNRETGEMLCENNSCGYSNGSWWARGTSWMVYGLSKIGNMTGDSSYIELAEKIARAYISQLGDSCIPVWDFRLPADMPAKGCGSEIYWDETDSANCDKNVDASAAAIMASALADIYKYTGKSDLYEFAVKSIEELCDNYLDKNPDVSGVISHQNGQMTYASYGDYYFVEALQKILYR